MSEHNFQMRMSTTYTDSENTEGDRTVEQYIDNEWQALDLNIQTPGFLIFVYSVLACQQMHFRLGSTAHGLVLESSKGYIKLNADKVWKIESLHVEFSGTLKSGDATQETIDAISKRMRLCPVSRNLKPITDNKTVVNFN